MTNVVIHIIIIMMRLISSACFILYEREAWLERKMIAIIYGFTFTPFIGIEKG